MISALAAEANIPMVESRKRISPNSPSPYNISPTGLSHDPRLDFNNFPPIDPSSSLGQESDAYGATHAQLARHQTSSRPQSRFHHNNSFEILRDFPEDYNYPRSYAHAAASPHQSASKYTPRDSSNKSFQGLFRPTLTNSNEYKRSYNTASNNYNKNDHNSIVISPNGRLPGAFSGNGVVLTRHASYNPAFPILTTQQPTSQYVQPPSPHSSFPSSSLSNFVKDLMEFLSKELLPLLIKGDMQAIIGCSQSK